MRVYLQFILNPPLPPHHGSDHSVNQRDEHENNPTQPAQPFFAETESKRLWDFWRDPDKLFPTQQPVHTAGNEIERLLILRDRIVLNKSRVADCHQARGIHLHPLIPTAAFL